MNSQVKAILTHVTLIGWIIILIINSNEKDELTSFYLRQTLGIYLILLIGTIIPALGIIIGIIGFILWVISLVGQFNKTKNLYLLWANIFRPGSEELPNFKDISH